MFCPEGKYFPSFSADRRLFPGRDEQGPGYQKEQSDLCSGSRFPETPDVINKGLTEEVILEGAARAFQGGWTRVKLYFMLGLPTETEEDMKGIAHLAEEIAKNIMRYQKTSATADVRSWSALLSLCLSLLRLSSGQECSGKRITWIRQKW